MKLMDTYLGLYVAAAFIVLVPTLMLINHLIPRPSGLIYHHRTTDGALIAIVFSIFMFTFVGVPIGMKWLRHTYPEDISDYLDTSTQIYKSMSMRQGTVIKWTHRLAIPVLLTFSIGFGLLTRVEDGVGPDGILYRSNPFQARLEIPFSDLQSLIIYDAWENRLGKIKRDTRLGIRRHSTPTPLYLNAPENAREFLKAVRMENGQVPIQKKGVLYWKDH